MDVTPFPGNHQSSRHKDEKLFRNEVEEDTSVSSFFSLSESSSSYPPLIPLSFGKSSKSVQNDQHDVGLDRKNY
jgi:hypothetical protein